MSEVIDWKWGLEQRGKNRWVVVNRVVAERGDEGKPYSRPMSKEAARRRLYYCRLKEDLDRLGYKPEEAERIARRESRAPVRADRRWLLREYSTGHHDLRYKPDLSWVDKLLQKDGSKYNVQQKSNVIMFSHPSSAVMRDL